MQLGGGEISQNLQKSKEIADLWYSIFSLQRLMGVHNLQTETN
jgi:hypothetical protein